MARNQQVVRQWKLLRHLDITPGGIAVAEYARADAARERMFYRDVEALQEAGFPLYADDIGGQRRWLLTDSFRGGRGVPLPFSEILALRCARSALQALEHTVFHEALHALIDKLDALLTPPMREFAQALDDVFVGDRFGHQEYGELRPIIDALSTARTERRSADVLYRSPKGETRRRIDPYNIWLHRNKLYVVARQDGLALQSTWRSRRAGCRMAGAALRRTDTATSSGGLWAAKVFCLPVGSATTKPSRNARSPVSARSTSFCRLFFNFSQSTMAYR